MPEIQSFCGLRYDLGHVGILSDVVAPPYDTIDAPLQDQLYKKHAANIVRLILNREEPGDDQASNRYHRAGRFLKQWRREGVLFKEPDPAVYVYHQHFRDSGHEYTRRGFMCRVRLARFGQGNIYPHEQTYAGPKADRLRLMNACKANLSQIFGLFPDPESETQRLLDTAIAGITPVEATDHLGVVHRMWPVTDVSVITALTAVMGPKPIYVADGHHRYETACDYRDEIAAREGKLDTNHPANFVLIMCISMSDPGLVVLPTHRLFRGLTPITSEQLLAALGDCFAARLSGQGSGLVHEVWQEIQRDNSQGTLGFYCQQNQRWLVARLTDAGRTRLARLAADQSDAWRSLGVAILHRLVLEDLLNIRELPRPEYVHRVDEVIRFLDEGDSDNGQFTLAALVMPASVEHVRIISDHGERMPHKSTYFYPKLLSGLVINPLE